MEPRLEVNGFFCHVRRSKVAKRSRHVEWEWRSIGVESDGGGVHQVNPAVS